MLWLCLTQFDGEHKYCGSLIHSLTGRISVVALSHLQFDASE